MSEMWSTVADGWDRHAALVDTHMAAATEALLDAAGVGPGSAVLDLGAGPGGAGLAAAARVGERGRVVLSDLAPAMVAVARRRSEALPQVDTMVCDQLAIDAPDATFDAVLCRHGLMFVETPGDAVREAVRVLRPGGRYAAMTWDARHANPWLGLVLDAMGEELGTTIPPPGFPGPFSLDDPDVLAGALRAGGLGNVEVVRLATPMRQASLEAWWDLVPQLAGPLAVVLAGMEAGVRDAIRRGALETAAAVARETEDGIELDGSVLIGSGRRAGS